MTYPEIDSSDDRAELLNNDGSDSRLKKCCGHVKKHRVCWTVLIAFLIILIGNILAVYFIYFHKSTSLKILGLNCWGMPAAFGSKDKEQRIKAIAEEVAKANYDIYLFEELWMEPDHTTIYKSVPKGYEMTLFRDLQLSTCDGRVGPEFCSGLSVISKYPILEKEFNSYTYHGDIAKATIDGEWLARKGIGRVRISPAKNLTVDLFITHTAADPDPSHGYNNSYYRVRQVKELMDKYIPKSTADVVILEGDFNAAPIMEEGEPYYMIRQLMKNSIEEIYYKLDAWLNNPDFATYGNQKNTWSNTYSPVIYDYIFHKANNPRTGSWTYWFDMPFFKFLLADKDELVSFSDHEAVVSTIHVRKWKDTFPYL